VFAFGSSLHCSNEGAAQRSRCVRSGTAKLKPCPSPTCPRADLPHIHPHHTTPAPKPTLLIPSHHAHLPYLLLAVLESGTRQITTCPCRCLALPCPALPCPAFNARAPAPAPVHAPGYQRKRPNPEILPARCRQPRVHAHRHPVQIGPRRMDGWGCPVN
jgi:hypothetical protein